MSNKLESTYFCSVSQMKSIITGELPLQFIRAIHWASVISSEKEAMFGFTRERNLASNISAQVKIVCNNHFITAVYTAKCWIFFSIMEEMASKSATNFENATQHFFLNYVSWKKAWQWFCEKYYDTGLFAPPSPPHPSQLSTCSLVYFSAYDFPVPFSKSPFLPQDSLSGGLSSLYLHLFSYWFYSVSWF